jgi:hypothetical protein
MLKNVLESLRQDFLSNPNYPYMWIFIGSAAFTALQYNLGVLYSWDSNWYLIFSESMSENMDFDRKAVYAPLYYFSLSILQFLGFTSEGSVVAYWFICYSALVFFLYRVTKSVVASLLIFVVIVAVEATGVLYRFAWTELGYATILVAASVFLYEHLAKGKSKKSELAFLVCLSLLPVQRYIGGYIAVYMGLVYLSFSPSVSCFFKRSRRLALATIPLVSIILWNMIISGEVSGPRPETPYSYAENFNLAESVIFNHFKWVWFLWLLCIASSAAVLVLNFKGRSKYWLVLVAIGLVPAVQALAQIHSSSIYQFDEIGPRFFIVLVPFFYAYFLIVINEISYAKRWFFMSASVLGVFLLSYSGNGRYDFFEKNNIEKSTAQIRDYLGEESPSTVGFYIRGQNHLAAEYILSKKILPNNMCKEYRLQGSFRDNDRYVYLPKCDVIPGHQFVMVRNSEEFSKQHINVVYKQRLPEDWRVSLNVKESDEIIDAGHFWIVNR